LGKTILLSEAVKELLLAYPWPGNVRELMSAIHQAVICCLNSELQPTDFRLDMRREAIIEDGKMNSLSLKEMERQYIAAVLEAAGGNIVQACKILGIDRHTLLRKMRKYELSR
jgi:transcriptional regulator of acetoin/glycerol metabolism